ncbi:drug transporter [Mycolicibacterium mageritense DSM 44476 = CIP 104973]|uniref:MFS transporter n=1 Tax=Mycolicibacterium mageritense TaxID=53462 RepID=A0AAI8U039_MYCME|nr:MDR family MFS transporter [Mycolicibacterium mageritense]OKH72883.1 MFS transporter [Mycobacterium sp. SWH-M3]TXI56723.1 MAG: DHA2 family efflux MFS transporter permease subunit [Mycolicibacterium mageritense]CDO26025.1 drug transporter [Mycolicibacterium mageritense DSM 44476 = CIP 104973]BBX37307.1 MFS transporter [Mycolicibacterium mageritense]BDY32115.1 Putative multidrug resistance protein MdtD [Mycolicibacterium mageritense]
MTSPPTTEDRQPADVLLSPRRRNLVFVAVLLGMLLAALDQTIVATALPTVVADLGGAGHQSWVVTSYLLASTIVTAVVGKVGDLFGRKVVFQGAVGFFIVGSVLCGLSGSMTMLVASRALQGIGGGAIMVTATALIGEVIPLRDRGRYQGALGAVFGVTTVIGPLLGGFFTDHLSWRWAFWINIPVGIVVVMVAATAIPALARTDRPVIDYAGILFVGLGASGLTLATSWGGAEYAWTSPTIIGLFVGSVIALALFVRAELHAAEPILPMRLFTSPVFTMCCVLSFIVGFAMLGALTFLPTFMQFVDGVSATESGLRTLPMVAGLLITSTGSGALVGRTGRYKIFPVVGTAVMVVAFLLLSRMDAATPMPLQSLYLFILGTGIGMCMQTLILTVQNTSRFSDLGVATSGVTFFRTIGSSFGAAIFGSLFANFLAGRIPAALAASGAPPAAANSPKALHELPADVAAPIVDAYADSLGMVFMWAAPVALLGFVVALFLKEVPLREMDATAALDLGEGFGMPSTESAEKVLETAISRLMRNSPEIRLRTVAGGPGCELDVARLWALLQIYRQSQVFGTARLTEIGERLHVPHEVLEPTFAGLVADGYALRTGDQLWLTQHGLSQVDAVSAALVGRIVDKLAKSPTFDGRPDRIQVEAALERIAHRFVLQRDWGDDRAELAGAGTKN